MSGFENFMQWVIIIFAIIFAFIGIYFSGKDIIADFGSQEIKTFQ